MAPRLGDQAAYSDRADQRSALLISLRSTIPMRISKSQADKAGSALAKSADPDAAEISHFAQDVDEWRTMHGAPMLWMAESVRGRLARLMRHVAVGQRLKRKPQIIAKLRREKTRLAQMQDVGGCRAVVETSAEVILAADRIKRSGPYYEISSQSDYREEGRADTGYRAYHLVALRDDRQIEVQVRTYRQQAWAEAVERASNRSGFDLKSGQGPPEMIEYFHVASDAFHKLDSARPVPASMRNHLRALELKVKAYLPPVEVIDRAPPAQLRRREFSTKLNNWLIVYDWRAARFAGWSDLGTDTAVAATRYASFEQRWRHDDGYEVVLIGADSTDTIKRTHSHYFGKDPNDLDPLGFFAHVLRV